MNAIATIDDRAQHYTYTGSDGFVRAVAPLPGVLTPRDVDALMFVARVSHRTLARRLGVSKRSVRAARRCRTKHVVVLGHDDVQRWARAIDPLRQGAFTWGELGRAYLYGQGLPMPRVVALSAPEVEDWVAPGRAEPPEQPADCFVYC